MIAGDLVIQKGQHKGAFTLRGGYIVFIEGDAAVIMTDGKTSSHLVSDLEPYTIEYVTLQGNRIIPIIDERPGIPSILYNDIPLIKLSDYEERRDDNRWNWQDRHILIAPDEFVKEYERTSVGQKKEGMVG